MMTLTRDEVAALLMQHAPSLRVDILAGRHGLTYELDVDGTRYLACVLSSSRDYYTHRLNILAPHLTMLVVGQHDTRVILPVLALDEGYFYAPTEPPRWYTPDNKRTRKDAMVIIGGLLSGVEEAYEQLREMKPSTRYRYLALMRHYLTVKQGRQLSLWTPEKEGVSL